MTDQPRIVIIGAGPTGLGAGYRLRELGYRNFVMLEASDHVGGLASSEKNQNGFTYDIGGHVLFSHYKYFDELFEKLLAGDYQELNRESWVWMQDRFLPYPFQNNIRYLPKEIVLECLLGLIEAQKQPVVTSRFANFEELIYGIFGKGMAKYFMMPYNFKVWAHPPCMMSKEWIGERVSVVDIRKVLESVLLGGEEKGWGPNATFKYPRYGGTGGLFERVKPFVEDNLRLNTRTVAINPERKEITLEDGSRESYDALLSTMPLDLLIDSIDTAPEVVRDAAAQFRHSGSYIVGVGIKQPAPSNKNWIYFPESDCPFYRVTYLSNYSPEVVPDAATHYSLLCEISQSPFKPVDAKTVADETIRGLINTRMISERDQDDIVDVHVIRREYTYPVPSLERDAALNAIHPWLDSQNIYSRGRFGAWRYEVGNMDHSVAQGVEWVNRQVQGARDDELTYMAERGC
jgi:protoporphyrinogen oxidase